MKNWPTPTCAICKDIATLDTCPVCGQEVCGECHGGKHRSWCIDCEDHAELFGEDE